MPVFNSDASSSPIRRLVIIDPGLHSRMGHHYNYVRAVVDAAHRRGLETLVLGPFMAGPDIQQELSVVPVFRIATYAPMVWDYSPTASETNPVVQEGQQVLMTNSIVFADLLVRASPLCRPDDLIFVHTVLENQIMGITQWLGSLPGNERPRSNILLRFWHDKTHIKPVLELCSTVLNSPALRARYSTDTMELSVLYSDLLRKAVDVVPIPMPIPYDALAPEARASRRRFLPEGLSPDTRVIAYAGDCRLQKGFHFIRPVIEELLREAPCPVHFLIQISDVNFTDEMRESVRAIAPVAGPNVTVVQETLSADDYYSFFNETDIMLINYDPRQYAYTSSGLFTEAMLLGKVSVIPAGTSMENEARRLGTGYASVGEFSALALLQALYQALIDYPVLAERSRTAMAGARRYHNADTLVSYLIGEKI